MTLATGTQLGPYEILAPLGAGGMGEVYRARDTRLGRGVAIKALTAGFVGDPERVARFRREAQMLAALNHPNIAAIHGVEDVAGAQFLVLELVEGESLADRLSHDPLPVAEAIPIALQIADALEAAHSRGIIHRDLKPANVMLTADGTVKVLDFGLAKPVENDARSDVSGSPTLSIAATQAGVLLGTAAYMSPEQAKGCATDKRTDVWAFGCVLYEILSGKRAFAGEDVADTLASVIRGEPDWTALPRDLPANVRRVLEGCLAKERKARIADFAVVRYILTDAAVAPVPESRGGRTSLAIAATAGAALAALAVWAIARWTPPPKLQPMRFAIVTPATQPVLIQSDRMLAYSPDGMRLAYVTGTGVSGQLVIRHIDQLEPLVLRGITSARTPFFSPDGRWIAYFEAISEIKKVPVTGGPPISVCRIAGGSRGASWGADDTIVFGTTDLTTGLMEVRAGGGEPKLLTKPDRSQGEFDHLFPSVLPGGRCVLFTVIKAGGPAENAQVAVLDRRTGERKVLIRGASHAEYVETGHLVYAAGSSLRAVRFDPERLEVRSDPILAVEQVATASTGAAYFSMSRTGALAYVPPSFDSPKMLVWVDRGGREQPIAAPPRTYATPRLSPDGSRIALEIRDQQEDIWIWELSRLTLTRLTMDPGSDIAPVWTPDGRRILFASGRSSAINIFSQTADGAGVPEQLTDGPIFPHPSSISPDGTRVVFREAVAQNAIDLNLLVLDGKRHIEPLVRTPTAETNGEISPDGRWLAYQSNESGRDEVYVRPFPNTSIGRWQLSTAGGTQPAWASSGRELFYLDPTGALMAVPITTAPAFAAAPPVKLFEGKYSVGTLRRNYDVARDSQKFVMIKQADANATQPSIVVVLNWVEDLRARIGDPR